MASSWERMGMGARSCLLFEISGRGGIADEEDPVEDRQRDQME